MSMMPHHIFVWDTAQHGAANSLEQAITMATDLAEQPSEPNPKFIQFAKYVQNHFKTAEGSEKSYYLDFDNEVQEHKTAALMVELPNDAWQPVLMCMVDAASRLGLAIYDEETQMAFMPPNVVLPASRLNAWEQLKKEVTQPRFPQTIKQLKTWIKPLLNDVLAKNGFDTKGVEHTSFPDYLNYTKKIALGTQFIDIQYESRYRGEFGISVMFGASSDIVNLISKKFNLPPYRIPNRIEANTLKLLGEDIIPCNSGRSRMDQYQHPNDVYEFLGHLETIVFPILMLAENINSLDKLINGSINNGVNDSIKNKVAAGMRFVDRRVRLIVARLANNPDFEELVLALKPPAPDTLITQWESIVNYLRQEIKPIEQWPEGFLTQLKNDILPNSEGFPTTKEPFRELLAAKVGDLVSEYGFVQTEAYENSGRFIVRYSKDINMGKLTISIFCEDVHNDNCVSEIRLHIIEDNMVAIAQKVNFSSNLKCDRGFVLIYNSKNIYISNWTTLNKLFSIIEDTALLWSDGIEDIKGIDALLNGSKVDAELKQESYPYLYDFYALITARLVNNPNFEELAVSLGTYDDESSQKWGKSNIDTMRKLWPKLVKYLREEVKPLV